MRRLATLSCALTLLAAPSASAQSGEVVTRDATGRVVVHATRIAQPIDIYGRLDDAVYGEVPAMTDFIQQEPKEGHRSPRRPRCG